MALSRLRLRLAAGFAFAFLVALAILAATALGYLWNESTRRLDNRLDASADGVASAVARVMRDSRDSSLAHAANEVVREWPANGDLFAIVDSGGALVAGVGSRDVIDRVLVAWTKAGSPRFGVDKPGDDYRASGVHATLPRAGEPPLKFGVLAFSSIEAIDSDTHVVAEAIAIAVPLILLLSLGAGYVLARRALRPVDELGMAIAGIAPTDLSQRLPVGESTDEVATLATEFNSLLQKLDDAQRRNRGFIREAAHQIRTPLTLVLGEAGHELTATATTPERMRGTLGRIRTAAEQMRRRVDELFLLAEAQAGEKVRLEDQVELDGLVLDCTDLMRERASALGRSLAIGTAEHVVVRGSAPLLQEALVELIENACRHGSSDVPVTVSCRPAPAGASLEVSSGGDEFIVAPRPDSGAPDGLGLPIVEWIARAHGGALVVSRMGALNVVTMNIKTGARDG
ncbi:MAG TPA: HAMP domain-containing sensor histidine kinase [Gemmatimonadaceae bacterium]|nr:HAMP domain-containing sensor histidine kinase [Gemmatimonadaceae bacterium]